MSRQVVLVDSSHFVDRDSMANRRRAVCDVAKFRYKSLCCRLLFEPRKILVWFSDIQSFATLRTIRFNPNQQQHGQPQRQDKKKKEEREKHKHNYHHNHIPAKTAAWLNWAICFDHWKAKNINTAKRKRNSEVQKRLERSGLWRTDMQSKKKTRKTSPLQPLTCWHDCTHSEKRRNTELRHGLFCSKPVDRTWHKNIFTSTVSLLIDTKIEWRLCKYIIVHTKFTPSPVILWIELDGKPKWLPLNFLIPWRNAHKHIELAQRTFRNGR